MDRAGGTVQDDNTKVTLRLVPQPEGFELRDKRSTKSKSCSDWEVQDALYSASQEIAKPDVECDSVVVIFRKRFPNGATLVCTRIAGPQDAPAELLLGGMAKIMGWIKRDQS